MPLAMSSRLTVVLLALMLGIQPVSTDLYLPTLPILTQEFGAPVSQVHMTLSALLLAFGISQLFWGPLSDMWGRRPVLILGLTAKRNVSNDRKEDGYSDRANNEHSDHALYFHLKIT